LIGLGSNLPCAHGVPAQMVLAALEKLKERGLQIVSCGRLYETAPVPISDQPWYVNTVAAVETDLPPEDLLKLLLDVEAGLGRKRSVQNAPRTIGLDLLAYNNQVHASDILDLPHPRLIERAFVLYPLRDVAPNWIHPVTKQTIGSLIADLPSGQEIRQIKEAA